MKKKKAKEMKTSNFGTYARRWTGGLVAMGLGLTGLTAVAGQTAAPPADKPDTATNDAQGWQNQMFDRMTHIQQEMDDLFRDTARDFDTQADTVLSAGPKFDASATVEDRGNDYVASFYLPKRDLSNVKVNIKDDALSVNAAAQQTTKSDKNGQAESETMLNQYEQIVTLPGPVDAGKMKIEKQGDELVVTIPKESGRTASAR